VQWKKRRAISPILLTCLCFQSVALGSRFASPETLPSTPRANSSPTLDSLPHTPLPEGQFLRWCGRDGAFLMTKENPTGAAAAIWVEGRSTEAAIPLRTMASYVECDETGGSLFVSEAGLIKKISLADKTGSMVARFQRDKLGRGRVTISPNGEYLAFESEFVRMEQIEQPDSVRLIPVGHSRQAGSNPLQWSQDSSRLFNIMAPRDGNAVNPPHQEVIQVIDVSSGKDATADLPHGSWFENGGFLRDGSALLFLRSEQNDVIAYPGSVFVCNVTSSVPCRSIISDVDEVSFGGEGVIASVKEIYKDPKRRLDGDALILPIAFVVEVRDLTGRVIARQRLARKGQQIGLNVLVSPSGNQAALVWSEWCATTKSVCWSGNIVNLRK
jgi:hypothetical protein